MSYHKGHLLRRHVLGGNYDVGFVLAAGIVEDDDKFSIFWCEEGPLAGRTAQGGKREEPTECLDSVWHTVELRDINL